LTIAHANGADVLRWSTNYGAGFSLEATNALSATEWNPVESPRVVSGSQFIVTNVVAEMRLFYRLRRP
jgi:hypothetical protein